MQDLIGKSCKLQVELNGKELFFTAKRVLHVSDTHITFLDKFGQVCSFRLQDLAKVQEINRSEVEK